MGQAVARDGDPCGGAIQATATKVLVNGRKVARVGDVVTAHGDGAHSNAVMVQGSASFFVGGKAVCRVGDAASCGHTVSAGSPDTFAA